MKRGMMLVLVFVVFLTSFSFFDSHAETVKMRMDGKEINFYVAQLKFDGKLLTTDVPPVIYNNRTLVPLRVILEHIDAQVEWNGDTYQVTVETEEKHIVLQINSSAAIVNGEKKSLPDNVPAKLINDRTMVPIRFIAEEIGLEVDWDQDTRTVLMTRKKEPESQLHIVENIRVNFDKKFPEVRIKTTGKLNCQVLRLVNPYRLVFDFENAKFDLQNKEILLPNNTLRLEIADDFIKEVRASQFFTDPFVTRVVVDTERPIGYESFYDEETGEMVITFINNIKNVKADIYNTKEVIVIEGDRIEEYHVMRLSNPERLVIDIKDSLLDNEKDFYTINVEGKVAKRLRISQFTPDHLYHPDDKIVRIVVDLQEKEGYDDFYFEIKDHCLVAHLEGKPIESIMYEGVDWTTSKLILKGAEVNRSSISRKLDSNILQIKVPKEGVHFEFDNIQVEDHIVKAIYVEGDVEDQYYHIEIELEDKVEHQVLSSSKDRELVLQFSNKNARYRELLIVIDPGHGGIDPGAISANKKVREADIVLDVSFKLNKLLKEAGFRTYMTRTDDSYLSIQDRAAVANILEADLFVSVHANAAASQLINGIENLYYPSHLDPKDNRDNRRLAQIFQSVMVKQLGAVDRGIVARDKIYVLRETNMPAVLTEIGFLTNPVEETKLLTDEYRQKVAEAILNAIVQYFNETRFQ